jgi:hypothetical protein
LFTKLLADKSHLVEEDELIFPGGSVFALGVTLDVCDVDSDIDVRADSAHHVLFFSLGLLLVEVVAVEDTLVLRLSQLNERHLTAAHPDE